MTTRKMDLRLSRRRRIRARVHGTQQRPRASVTRTNRMMRVQLIDDVAGRTLLALSSVPSKEQTKTEQAVGLGQQVARAAQEKGITQIVFDRGGWAYHGRMQALAEAMRVEGLKF